MKTVSVLMLLFGASPRGEVIELTMDNCFYCDQVEPTVLRLKQEGLPIRQIHAQRQPEEARRFGCDRFPTFLLLVDDKVVLRKTGAVSETELRQLVARIPAEVVSLASPKPSSPSLRVELGEPSPLPRPAGGHGVVAEAPPAAAEEKESSLFPRIFHRKPKPEPTVRGQSSETIAPVERTGEAALAASVRLNLHSAKGILQGSGTIIESHVGRTLVITAGTPFSQLPSGAKIEVDVPMAAAAGETRTRTFIAKLVKADLDADVALIEFPADQLLPRAAVAAVTSHPKLGDRAVCIGGGSGAAITRDQVRVTALNKYVGPDTIECSGVPLPGRCGGGLFNPSGELIGICIAVSEDTKTKAPSGGMYCGLKPIHDLLRSQNLAALYETPAVPANEFAALAETELGGARPMPADVVNTAATDDPAMAAFSRTMPPTQPVAANADSPAGSPIDDDQEVIVIIRSKKSPNTTSRVIHIHKASPKLRAILDGPSATAPAVTGTASPARATSSSGRRLNPPPLAAN